MKTDQKLHHLFLKGYIQNEVDLNPKESCMENCGYYSVTKQHGCFGGQFCGKQRGCAGEIFDCQYIDSDMWVCQSVSKTMSITRVVLI